MHNHTMFLTCLYPSVSALNHAPPPPPQPYGPFPDVKGALGSPVNKPLPPIPSPPHSRPLPARSWGF